VSGDSILIRNGNCIDPLHNVEGESKDLLIKDGLFHPINDGKAWDTKEIDAGGRIVVPGGILPSFKLPVGVNCRLALDLAAGARALIETGFTTVVVDGITPFTALDVHQQMQRLPVVNKVPIIDLANFQFFTGFLKNGVANYAAAVAASMLGKLKGYGVSAIGPGSTLGWSSPGAAKTRSIREPIPFLNLSIEKLATELVAIHGQGSFKPGFLVETGIEGFPASREELDALLAKIAVAERNRGPAPPVAMKQLARYAMDPAYKSGDIAENVSAAVVAMKGASSIAGLMDLPSLDFDNTTFVDNVASPLHDPRHILARGIIEGELFVITYSINDKDKKDLATRYWLAGMNLVLDLPGSVRERVAFSLMPQLISGNANITSAMGCLLSERYRLSKKVNFHGAANQSLAVDLLRGKVLTFPELVFYTRAAPARIFGLDKLIGGLGEGQLGDAIILNAHPGDIEGIRDEPDQLHDMLCNPHAVIKGGRLAFENGHLDQQIKGYTILHDVRGDPSIAESIEQNLDKQFLKYYSTHLDGKIVPASLVKPSIND